MTAQSPGHGSPATSAPGLVPQQGTGLRVLRILLIVLLLGVSYGESVGDLTPLTGAPFWVRWSVLATLAALILLIVGPQPRWATKWAWFWLIDVVPMAAVFLLLEPVPVWQGEPAHARPSRLTGGWAFLLALSFKVILTVVALLVVQPWLAVMSGAWWLVP